MKAESMKRYILALLATAATSLPVSAAVSTEDQNFIKNTAQAGMTEVELGNIAKKKASSNSARQFAENMIKDHTAANNKLKAIAEKKGVAVPTAFDRDHQALVDKFNAMEKTNFDNAYANQMVADHRKVVASLETQSGKGDTDLQNFSKETLPTIKHHLQMAEQISAGK